MTLNIKSAAERVKIAKHPNHPIVTNYSDLRSALAEGARARSARGDGAARHPLRRAVRGPYDGPCTLAAT